MEAVLARDNYSYIRFQKELAKKKKKEEARQAKLDKKNALVKDSQEQVSGQETPVV